MSRCSASQRVSFQPESLAVFRLSERQPSCVRFSSLWEAVGWDAQRQRSQRDWGGELESACGLCAALVSFLDSQISPVTASAKPCDRFLTDTSMPGSGSVSRTMPHAFAPLCLLGSLVLTQSLPAKCFSGLCFP